MMLAVSAVLFGSFLLTSVYLQEVLGASALMAAWRSFRWPWRSGSAPISVAG